MPSTLYTLYYDGACPLCQKEVAWLKKRGTKRANGLSYIDISQEGFDADQTGKSLNELMQLLHLRDSDGQWWVAMEATRKVYREIGLGWLMAPTGWPLLKPCFDWAYKTFARYRPRLQRKACERCIR